MRFILSKKRKNLFFSCLLLAPTIVLLSIVILIPELYTLFLSFTEYSPGQNPIIVGVRNYLELVEDSAFLDAIVNNLVYLVLVVFFEFMVGFGSALLLNRQFPFQRILIGLVIAPYAVSLVVAAVIWRYMLDSSSGIINFLISWCGFSPVQWFGSVPTSFSAVIIISVWKNSPFIMMIAYAALMSLPTEVYEAADIDGANFLQKFWLITLPLITPALSVALLFRTVFAIRAFGEIWILTEGGPGRGTEILSVYLYKESFRYFNFGKGSAVAFIMLVITLVLSMPIIRGMYRTMFSKQS
jgi:multiple sugar transport system permease protein